MFVIPPSEEEGPEARFDHRRRKRRNEGVGRKEGVDWTIGHCHQSSGAAAGVELKGRH